jgi:hypothetical protein
MTSKNIMASLLNINEELLIIILGFFLYNFHYLLERKSIFINIVITSFVLAIFDVFLKNTFI